MNIIDYVILGLLAISMIVGFFKGLLKQLLTVAGIIVVAMLTATVSPYVQNWFVNVIESDSVRTIVAMIATVILLAVVYGILAWLLGKLLKKIRFIKVLDKILGGVMGIAIVYLIFAVVYAIFNQTSAEFMQSIKQSGFGEKVYSSWFNTNIYGGDSNFFGNWIIGIAQDLLDKVKSSTEAASLALIFA